MRRFFVAGARRAAGKKAVSPLLGGETAEPLRFCRLRRKGALRQIFMHTSHARQITVRRLPTAFASPTMCTCRALGARGLGV